jgi:hypothetical protein
MAKTLALIDACFDILVNIHPATVRAVCYQLFIRKLLDSMAKKHTDRVSTQLVYARRNNIVPWEWIVDETRGVERPGTWENPEALLAQVIRQYRKDRWGLQSRWVEVWSEKGTVRGTLGPLLEAMGVNFRVMHGNTSWTEIHAIKQECLADPRPVTAFYVGDFDPSGMFMSVIDLPHRLADHGINVTVERLAVHGDQARARGLPSFPASDKKKDPHYPWFVREYGEFCWELDAMSPVDLRAIVEDAIWAHIDAAAWQQSASTEAAEHRSMRDLLTLWRAVKTG